MGSEALKMVDEYIQAMAKSLGVASEYVFKTLVHQQFIEGVVYSAMMLLLSIGGGITMYKSVKYYFKNKRDMEVDEEDAVALGVVIGAVIYVVILIGTTAVLPQSIMKLFNPQYYAIKEILEVFKK